MLQKMFDGLLLKGHTNFYNIQLTYVGDAET